jgi:hypothetical protein
MTRLGSVPDATTCRRRETRIMNLASTCCRHLSSSVVVGGVAPRSAQLGTDENPGVMDIGNRFGHPCPEDQEGHLMLHSSIVNRRIRQSFDHVNDHRWDELLRSIAPNVRHRFLGAHAIGGERHDRETLRLWFERLARVLPSLHLKINDILPTRHPRHHAAVGQDPCARCLRGLGSRPSARRPGGSWPRRGCRRTDPELGLGGLQRRVEVGRRKIAQLVTRRDL